MRKILLDTNAYCAFMAGDQEILQAISKADCVYMSVFVRGELYYGFRGGTKGRQNRQWLEQFTKKATVQILDATDTTAQIFGDIKYALRKAGTPIPVNVGQSLCQPVKMRKLCFRMFYTEKGNPYLTQIF